MQNETRHISDPFLRRFIPKRIIKQSAYLTIALILLMIPSGIASRQQIMPIVEAAVELQTPPSDLLENEAAPSGGAQFSVDIEPVDPPVRESLATPSSQRPFHTIILQAAKTYQVDPALIRAIIMAESNYDPRAVSHAGAEGLMQLMPTTAKWLGVADSFDPALNIDGGVRYFRYLLDRFKGDVELALAAYNAGILYVQKYGGVPPFAATQAYIKKVLHYHHRYQQEMAANDIDAVNA
jgi:soluble lytic murein transglycosylase-like protein